MSVFNLLTEEDKEKIINYIDMFGPTDDNASTPRYSDIERVLTAWDYEKSRNLQKLFGGDKLILNRPYTYTMSVECVTNAFEDAINEEGDEYYFPFKKWIQDIVADRSLIRAIEFDADNNGWGYSRYDFNCDLFDTEALATNSYQGHPAKIHFADSDDVFKIAKGMKPMKIFHKLVDRFGDSKIQTLYENFRNWHSMMLNQIHLDGTLSLSIHPLDYMTMSDNGGNWESCMRWQDGGHGHPGDYRMGTVVCMNSPYIVVAYLHNPKKKMEIWNYQTRKEEEFWNKKKWRELFIVQDGFITEIKGYPYQDENLTNTALMWLKELAQENLGWTYEDIETDVSHDFKRPEEDENKNFIFRFHSDYMYNDFGTLKKHRGRLNWDTIKRRAEDKSDELNIAEYYYRDNLKEVFINAFYGGYATCMCCGQEIEYDENRNQSVFCYHCEPYKICPCCGEVYDGDGYYISAYSEPVCYGCYEYECSTDDLTGDCELNDSLVIIYIQIDEEDDGTPIFVDECISTLDPDTYDNPAYDKIFTSPPLKYREVSVPWSNSKLYVTFDMIQDIETAENVFDLDIRYYMTKFEEAHEQEVVQVVSK